MKSCVYDNPNSASREYWVDKHLICSISIDLIYMANPSKLFKNMKAWQPGEIIGDKEAISDDCIGEESGN